VRKTAIDLLSLAKMLIQPGVFRILPNSPFTIMLVLQTLEALEAKEAVGLKKQLSA
jgi:hypothetical protein